MKWLVVVVLVAACASVQVRGGSEGSPLAALELAKDIDGAVVGHDARPTIVVSFASWCPHCRHELAMLTALRQAHPNARVLGINYMAFELYNHRGNATAVRTYVADNAPWLRVVPVDDALFERFGSPPRVPTMWVFAADGSLARTFDPRRRRAPAAAELDDLLRQLGA